MAALGATFDSYGVSGDSEGWVEVSWQPAPLACNPHGIVQAGVHAVLLDAAMNFAINAALPGKDRTRATLELKVETMRPVRQGQPLNVRGVVTRMARQVAFAEGTVRDAAGALMSRSTGTFLLHRDDA